MQGLVTALVLTREVARPHFASKWATLRLYLRAFLYDFYPWALAEQWAPRIRTVADLDLALQEWMEARHEDGIRAHVGNNVVYCIKALSPSIYASLVDARSLLHDWNSLSKSVHWPPLSLPLVLLLAVDRFDQCDLGPGLAFLLGFLAQLRVSEIAALRVCDVVFPDDPRFWGEVYVLLILQHTKTGDDKSAEVQQRWVWPLLRSWVAHRRAQDGPRAKLFPSAAVLRVTLGSSLRRLGLGHVGFVMHSLRAGGTLYLINLGVAMDEVLRRGRWRRPESARPYLQRLRALQAYTTIPAAVLQRGAMFAAAPSLVMTEALRGANLLV